MNCFHAQLDSALFAAESLKKSPNRLAMDKFNLAAGSHSALLMICLGLGALALASIGAKAHMNGMYETQAAAEKRAAELKLRVRLKWMICTCPVRLNGPCTKHSKNHSDGQQKASA
jgi:hypothetical protein